MSARHTMSTADAAWLHMDRRTNLMVINSVMWFGAELDWARVQEVFRERVVERFPRFSQCIDEGPPGAIPGWRDDPGFELGLHFHRMALPAPGDREALQDLVSDLIATPLDRGKPLWDVYLLEGFGEGCALLVRMHHAIADGIALARVMLSLTDEGGRPLDFVPPRGNGDAPSGRLAVLAGRATQPAKAAANAARAVVHEGVETLLHPEKLAPLARSAEVDLRAAFKLIAPGSDPQTSLKGVAHVAHRVAWADPVPLTTIKRAGRARGATVNDVLVAAVAGAVGRHLRRTTEGDVDEVHALVPFNLRPLDQPLPRDLGNRFGLILLALPVGAMGPLERLRAVQDRMAQIKDSHEGAIAYGILGLIGRTPTAVETRLVDFFSGKGTMVLTNVPGPRRPVTFAGTPLAGVLVWAPCSGDVGMSVSVFSYAGSVTVGFLTDAGLVPDPQTLADDFRREVLLLARHARASATQT